MFFRFLSCLAAASIGLAAARAEVLASYDFTTGSLGPASTVNGNITAGGFYAPSNSKAAVGSGGNYAYILIKKKSEGVNSAISNAQFAQFTISVNPATPIQLDQLQFTAGRGGESTPRGIVVRWSLDGYTNNLAVININSQWPKRQTYTFPTKSYVGDSVTFRLYAFAEQDRAEPSVRFSNLKVIGGFVQQPPVVGPTVNPYKTRLTTSKNRRKVNGSANASAGIQSVVVYTDKNDSNDFFLANGTTRWNFVARNLKPGSTNRYYVASVDKNGNESKRVKVVIKRRNKGN